jgi:hypothetical protein
MHLLTTDNKVYELVAGPFNFDSHTFSFQSGGCSWNSGGGTQCGSCTAQPWSLGPLNCVTGAPGPQRVSTHLSNDE